MTFAVTVRNTGNEPAPFTEILFRLPWEGLFVDLEGLPEATRDLPEGLLTATVDLPAGAERQFLVRVVVPRDSGGHVLRPDLLVRFLYRGVTFSAGEPLEIDTVTRASGLRLGGVAIAPAGLAVLAVMALYPALWFGLPRARRSRGAIAALVIASGFLTLFAALAWKDWQTLSSWRDASCTILDTRLRIETERSRIKSGQPARYGETTNVKSLLALRYEAAGHEVISTGYDTGTRVTIGLGARSQREFAQWKVGSTVPCWYNPGDAGEVVVIRGFGGAYLFALAPLALLAASVVGLARRR